MSDGAVRLRWKESIRIVGAEHGPIDALERVADPGELDAVLAFEALTSPDAANLQSRLRLVAPGRRITGPGSSDAMAPFLYFSAPGGRFSDGSYGVYYAARDRPTAIAETVFHRERLLRESGAPSMVVRMRVLRAALDVSVRDIRGTDDPTLIDPDPSRYGAAQAFGAGVRATGDDGIVYDSVRRPGGECVALFTPRAVGQVRRAERLHYEWSAARSRIESVTELLQ